jgi:hypothetical protein
MKVAVHYQSCMNIESLYAHGTQPFLQLLHRIGVADLQMPHNLTHFEEVQQRRAHFQRALIRPFNMSYYPLFWLGVTAENIDNGEYNIVVR